MVFVDGRNGHEAFARLGQRDFHRAGVEVEHRFRIEHVPVWPYADAFNRQLADMDEFAQCSALHELREVHVSFGAIEVVGGDGHGIRRPVTARAPRLNAASQHEAYEKRSAHFFSVALEVTAFDFFRLRMNFSV